MCIRPSISGHFISLHSPVWAMAAERERGKKYTIFGRRGGGQCSNNQISPSGGGACVRAQLCMGHSAQQGCTTVELPNNPNERQLLHELLIFYSALSTWRSPDDTPTPPKRVGGESLSPQQISFCFGVGSLVGADHGRFWFIGVDIFRCLSFFIFWVFLAPTQPTPFVVFRTVAYASI